MKNKLGLARTADLIRIAIEHRIAMQPGAD
jgi:hypothetical protein